MSTRPRPTRYRATRPRRRGRSAPEFYDAETVVELLGHSDAMFAEPTVIGVEPAVDECGQEAFDLHLALLDPDHRGVAAGLFGLRARPEWHTIALAVTGRARDPGTDEVLGDARGVVAVDRHTGVASRLHVDGAEQHRSGPDGTSGAPSGAVVDALHRVLGLRCPGDPPHASHLALALWYLELVTRCEQGYASSWNEAVLVHPGSPCIDEHPVVHVSVETVVEATLRTEGTVSWPRMHWRALDGNGPASLTRDEVAWMDPTFYGRWIMGSLPDLEVAVTALTIEGQHLTAERVAAVAAEVHDQLGAPSPYD